MAKASEPDLSQLKSPRAAAINGILFTMLSMITMYLVQDVIRINPADINQEWLESHEKTVSLTMLAVPFIGITFLWFTGVLRDWMADRHDRFFSTVFFGSGLLFVGMLFVWAAAFGALFSTYAAAGNELVDKDVYIYGYAFMNEILGDFTLRMMGVYMSSIATLWTRTRIMPRWLIIITYIFALILIIFAGTILKARFVFPCWVFLVSAYILVHKFRRTERYE